MWRAILHGFGDCLGVQTLALMRVQADKLVPVAGLGSPFGELPLDEGRLTPDQNGYAIWAGDELQGALLVVGASDLLAKAEAIAPLLDLSGILLRETRKQTKAEARARARQASLPQARILEGVHELAVTAASAPDSSALAQLAVRRSTDLLGVDYAAIYWWDPAMGGLRLIADNDTAPGALERVLPLGPGTVASAFQARMPVVVEDYPSWEQANPAGLSRGVQSSAGVPLLVGDRAVGVLAVRNYTRRLFPKPEVELLELFAAQVAPALELTRLYAESERERAIAEALADLVRRGAAETSPDPVIRLVLQEACRLLGSDYAAVALYDAEGSLQWRGVWGNRSDIWIRRSAPARGGTVDAALASGRTIIAVRVGENPAFPPESMRSHLAEGGTTVLGTPLVTQGNSIGGVVLGWRRDLELTDEQVNLAEALAGYSATIIDTARAHADALARSHELDASLRDLSASQQRLQTLYEAVSCGVLVRDRAGAIVHANAAAEAIFGVPFETMQGRTRMNSPWRLEREDGSEIPPEGHPSAIVSQTGEPVRGMTFAIVRPDGGRRWLLADCVPIRAPDGSIDQLVSSFIDIHPRVEAEMALKEVNEQLEQRVEERTRELSASYKELEAFSYSVSHDLRAPLRGMDGLAQALLEDYGDRLDQAGKDFLARIRAASQRMGRMIDAILTLSRVARAEVRRQRVNLSAIATSVVADLQRSYADRQVSVSIAPGIVARGDPDLLRLALQNLLDNSWKFTRGNTLAAIELGTLESAEMVYYVRDNGAGFDMAYVDKVFRPFEQLHDPKDYGGEGIGLASVQRVIQRHGGRIWAESAVGQGATFYFTLSAPD